VSHSDSMIARGEAVGVTPEADESVKAFGSRVRKAEKASGQPAQTSGGGYWRRGVWVQV
jgi:hypothetical protein